LNAVRNHNYLLQANNLRMVGERGFEPPTPWSRIQWRKEDQVTPSDVT
jgi:hypothetical protein